MVDTDKAISEIDGAILAHVIWIARFTTSFDGINREYFDPEAIRDDTACVFGRWFYANPHRFPDKATYERIKQMHEKFHAKAAEIASMLRTQTKSVELTHALAALRAQSRQLIAALNDAKSAFHTEVKDG